MHGQHWACVRLFALLYAQDHDLTSHTVRVAVTIQKSSYANNMTNQTNSLVLWTKEILDGTFATINSQGLIPDYIQGQSLNSFVFVATR